MQDGYQAPFVNTYCIVYAVLCAALIVALAVILHRAGTIFLHDAFPGRADLVRAVARLLDVGFYLVCFGYVALTFETMMPLNTVAQVRQAISMKIGWFLLLLGFMHIFNLLLLALFRRRGLHPAVAERA